MGMRRSITHPRNRDLSDTLHNKKRKAALGVAFRWSPVALSFLFSSLCVSFLVHIQPVTATSNNIQDSFIRLTTETEFEAFSLSSDVRGHVLSPCFTKEVLFWEKEILDWANTYQLDPNLVAVVMQIESCGNPNVLSRSGAIGLFQVMPFHFTKDEDPFDPETNAHRGLSYLSGSMNMASNDPVLALAGYNGGHSMILLEPDNWPAETKRYVYWGWGILADIYTGEIHSSRLDEWMQAGGESLCDRSSAELGF
jgi:hypothetical protein